MIAVVATDQQVGLLPRILIAVVICVAAVPMLYVCFKALAGIRKMPRRKMSHRQAVQVSAILGVWLLLMATGALIGNLSSDRSTKAEGTIGGLFVGAFTWVILCWIIGGIARAHHARDRRTSPGIS